MRYASYSYESVIKLQRTDCRETKTVSKQNKQKVFFLFRLFVLFVALTIPDHRAGRQ